MAYASVDVEACHRRVDCNGWCSNLANCATGFGKKPSEENCWFAKTSSDPMQDLQNNIVKNNLLYNISTALELDLVGRPTMQHLNGRAVNGTFDSEGEVRSCSHIRLNSNDYWGVNLGGRYKITEVEVTSSRMHRIHWMFGMANYRVAVSDVELSANAAKDFGSPDFKTCNSHRSITREMVSVNCDSYEGSFVYIYIPFHYMDLCTVRVFASGSCCKRTAVHIKECPTKVNYC